MAASIRVYFIW